MQRYRLINVFNWNFCTVVARPTWHSWQRAAICFRGGLADGRTCWGFPKLLEIGTARMQTISSYNCQNEGLCSTQFPFLPSNPPSYTRRQMFAVVCTTAVPANIKALHIPKRWTSVFIPETTVLALQLISSCDFIILATLGTVICGVWWDKCKDS